MKALATVLFLFLATASFGQTKKVALLTTTIATDDEMDFAPFVRSFIEGHLKTLPGVTIAPFNTAVSTEAKKARRTATGTFIDNAVLKAASATGSAELVLVYYNIGVIEKKVLDPGKESTSYGCEMELFIQLVNISNGQIVNSKKFFLSKGMTYKEGENFKTKEEAVKATLASPAFADDKATIPANVDTYLAGNIK